MNDVLIPCSIAAYVCGFLTALAIVAYTHEYIRNYIRRRYFANRFWPISAQEMEIRLKARIADLEAQLMEAARLRYEAMQTTAKRHDHIPEYIRAEIHPEASLYLLKRQAT